MTCSPYESPIAQWLEHPTGIWKVVGLMPVKVLDFFSEHFFVVTIYFWQSFIYELFSLINFCKLTLPLLVRVANQVNQPLYINYWKKLGNIDEKSLLTDAVCLEECQKQLRSLYETSSKVKIIPWDQNSAVDIDKIYTDLSWVMDDRTPRGVIQENLDHYTEIFAHREPRRAPKRILVYGQPGKWVNEVKNLIVLI